MQVITCALLHLKRMIKYKSVILGCLTIPVIIVCALAYLNKGQSSNNTIYIDVVNIDKGNYGYMLLSELKTNKKIHFSNESLQNAEDRVKNNTTAAAIVIPDNFSEEFKSGEEPNIKILKLNGANTELSLDSSINTFITKNLIKNKLGSKIKNTSISLNYNNITTDVRVAKKDNAVPLSNSISISLTISFLMYSMIYIVNELNSLKKNRTLRRCLSTPRKNSTIVASIVLAFLVIGWLEVLIMVGIPRLFLNLSWGSSYSALFLVFTALLLVILSMGLLMSRFTKNEQMAPVAVNMVVTITCMVSGCFMPLDYMGSFMKKLALFTPQNWALTAITDIALKNKGVIDILPNLGVLLLFALAFFTAASSSMKKLIEN